MRCSSYCIADSILLDELASSLKKEKLQSHFFDDVLHIQNPKEGAIHDVFCFNYGCVIFWGFSEEEEKAFLEKVVNFAKDAVEIPSNELCNARLGDVTIVHEEDNTLELASEDPLLRLSFSHGLAQSVKLFLFEKSIEKSLMSTRPILDELATKGRSSLSRKQLSQKIGDLFAKRNSINLHCDILDTPEFFWRRPKYEPFYLMSAQYMDIGTRMDIMNKRLDVIHELYDILSNELKHAHSSFLEIVIILLIVSEVVLAVLKDVLKWL